MGLSGTLTWHFGSWDNPRPCAYNNQNDTAVFVARSVRWASVCSAAHTWIIRRKIRTDKNACHVLHVLEPARVYIRLPRGRAGHGVYSLP